MQTQALSIIEEQVLVVKELLGKWMMLQALVDGLILMFGS